MIGMWLTLGMLCGIALVIYLIVQYLKSLWEGMKNPYKTEEE